MTTRAVLMSGENGLCGIVIATVTIAAGDRRVPLACVEEFRIIEFIALRVRRGKRKKEKEKKKGGPNNCSARQISINHPSKTAVDSSRGREPQSSKRAAEAFRME